MDKGEVLGTARSSGGSSRIGMRAIVDVAYYVLLGILVVKLMMVTGSNTLLDININIILVNT